MGISKRPFKQHSNYWIFGLIFLLSNCSEEKHIPKWMIGCWKSSFDGIAIKETWKSSGDHYTGTTVWTWDGKHRMERLRLFYNGQNELTYRVKMETKTIDFICQDPFDDTVTFVNERNDFPKRLVYVKPNGKKMTVWIENEKNDANRMVFIFEKIR